MTNTMIVATSLGLALSFLIPLVTVVCFIALAIKRKLNPDKKAKRNSNFKALMSVFALIVSISCAEFALELFRNQNSVWVNMFKSLVSGMRAIGGEIDFVDNLEEMKQLFSELGLSFFKEFFIVWYSGLNCVAPIAGGAAILDVLMKIFPRLGLKIYMMQKWRKKYFFSDLNESSLALAESILENNKKFLRVPVIVFADAYREDENEESNELFVRARNIGAYCITDDIAHYAQRRISNIEFLLIKIENEIENIQTLAALVEEDKYKILEKSTIRIFYQDDSYALTEHQIHLRLREKFSIEQKKKIGIGDKKFVRRKMELALDKLDAKDPAAKRINKNELSKKELKKFKKERLEKYIESKIEEEMREISDEEVYEEFVDDVAPVVTRTRPIQNLIFGLLEKKPLYTPLVKNFDQKELNVCIMGGGTIGMEMLLGSYWCGQLLYKKLGINMVSLEDEKSVVDKINAISPEILRSSMEGDILLSVFDCEWRQKRIDELKKKIDEIEGETHLSASAKEKAKKTLEKEISILEEEIERLQDVYSEPYFTFRYAQADLTAQRLSDIELKRVKVDTVKSSCASEKTSKSDNSESESNEESFDIFDCDYYLVASGSDEKNIVIAEKLRRELIVKQLESGKKKSAVIVCVVYNPALCSILNEGKVSMLGGKGDSDIEVLTVGGLNDVYSFKNIYGKSELIPTVHSEYVAKTRKELIKESRDRIKKAYDFHSSKASAIHRAYKSFCAYEYRVNKEKLEKTWDDWCNDYPDYKWCLKDVPETTGDLRQMMGWLEHRRWNAYIRSCGFEYSSKKEVMLKLHHCLVETKKPDSDIKELDRLDELSVALDTPYKTYDLPMVYETKKNRTKKPN